MTMNPGIPPINTAVDRRMGMGIFAAGLAVSALGLLGLSQTTEAQQSLDSACRADSRTAEINDQQFNLEGCYRAADRTGVKATEVGLAGLGIVATATGTIIVARRPK